MSDNSKIEWTQATWNVVTGCEEVSDGCDRCYAKTFAERWRGTPGHYFEQGFDLVLRPDKLDLPLRWRKPRKVFVNSMSDLFHKDVPDDFIARTFAVMAISERHTFQILTKRHARMRALLNSDAFHNLVAKHAPMIAWEHGLNSTWAARMVDPGNGPLRNIHLGVSVEDQHWADIRIPALRETPAAVRWLSCEPLLGPVDLDRRGWLWDVVTGQPGAIHWVVVGGESGPGARPMHPGWARNLRDQCSAAGVPFFFKQWGGRTPNAGGRELDGREWSEYPTEPAPVGGAR